METRDDRPRTAWMFWPIWIVFWWVVMQLLFNWCDGVSTAALSGLLCGVLMSATDEWKARKRRA